MKTEKVLSELKPAEVEAAVREQYDIDEYDEIRSPGSFEGEMYYIAYYHDLYLNGGAFDTIWATADCPNLESGIEILKVSDGERLAFELDTDTEYIAIHSDSQGFWELEELTAEEYETAANAPVASEEDIYINDKQTQAFYCGKLIAEISAEEVKTADYTRQPLEVKIRRWTRDSNYFPNVWQQDDHGGLTLVEINL